MSNPFRVGTQRYKVYERLSDKQWHCTKCDLEAAQAATFRDMKKVGISFDTDKNGNEYKEIFCITCGVKRVHRKLK
jgi:ribosomal protein L37AE/L43A